MTTTSEISNEQLIEKCYAIFIEGNFSSEEFELFSKLLTRYKSLTADREKPNYMKSSQAYVKELEQYGITDEVGYINRAMQNYAQQFIDDHIKSIQEFKNKLASTPKVNLVGVEKLVQNEVDYTQYSEEFRESGHYLTPEERMKLASELRTKIGYTLSDLPKKDSTTSTPEAQNEDCP